MTTSPLLTDSTYFAIQKYKEIVDLNVNDTIELLKFESLFNIKYQRLMRTVIDVDTREKSDPVLYSIMNKAIEPYAQNELSQVVWWLQRLDFTDAKWQDIKQYIIDNYSDSLGLS